MRALVGFWFSVRASWYANLKKKRKTTKTKKKDLHETCGVTFDSQLLSFSKLAAVTMIYKEIIAWLQQDSNPQSPSS